MICLAVTIHFEGTALSQDQHKIIEFIETFARNHSWNINEKDSARIVVTPHPKSESIAISLNNKQKFSGSVKTAFATSDVHKQVVKLFYELKPMMRNLSIEDESGYWLEYVDHISKINKNSITKFPMLTKKDLITTELVLPSHATAMDHEFWKTTPNYMDPFLNIAAIRDVMGYDLMNGSHVLTAVELKEMLESEGFTLNPPEEWIEDIEYLIHLATLWAWRQSSRMKATNVRRNKCVVFGWALARGCHGFGGGFINQLHRRAQNAIDTLKSEEGKANPIRSLEIFYGLFDFCGFKKEGKKV